MVCGGMNAVRDRDLAVLGDLEEVIAPPVPVEVIEPLEPVVVKERPIRDHHYRVARLIAEGKRTGEVAAEVGLTVNRVSILKANPAFMEVVEGYRARLGEIREAEYVDIYRKAALLRANALDVMNECYEEGGVTHIEARQDLAITNEMLDERVTKSVQLHGSLQDAKDMKEMSLAELVNSRRARADRLANAAASVCCLPDAAAERGRALPESVPAPSSSGEEKGGEENGGE